MLGITTLTIIALVVGGVIKFHHHMMKVNTVSDGFPTNSNDKTNLPYRTAAQLPKELPVKIKREIKMPKIKLNQTTKMVLWLLASVIFIMIIGLVADVPTLGMGLKVCSGISCGIFSLFCLITAFDI